MQQQGLEPRPCLSSPQPDFSASYHAMPFWLELMQAFFGAEDGVLRAEVDVPLLPADNEVERDRIGPEVCALSLLLELEL